MIDIIKKYEKLIKYFSYSCIATVVDVAVGWFLYSRCRMDLVTANTAAVVLGFIISYILSSQSVFNTKLGIAGFVIYLVTFFINLALADFLIVVSDTYLKGYFSVFIAFILSKGVSIVFPFFFTYFLRKYAYLMLEKRRNRYE